VPDNRSLTINHVFRGKMTNNQEELIMWVYLLTEPGLWTVGFYDPNGQFHSDSDCDSKKEAAKRVNYLNGGNDE